jgi:histidine triad (HIT) family protein
MSDTIFDKIVSGEMSAYTVWEDDNYLAFLTPFANTPGQTVVIPKTNQGDYIFNLDPQQVSGLVLAAQKVAKILESAFTVQKVALVFEGEGVAYVHAKLYPMHGQLGQGSGHQIPDTQFFVEYPGYITTVEGPQMSDEELRAVQQKIRGAQT